MDVRFCEQFAFFTNLDVCTQIFWWHAAASILMPPAFHIASLNHYTPKFSGVPQKLSWCQEVGLEVLPRWGDADFCLFKKAVFRCFLGKFSRPNGRLSTVACYTYLERFALSVNLSYLETILVHPTRRQSFAGKLHSTLRNIWDFVIFNHVLISKGEENWFGAYVYISNEQADDHWRTEDDKEASSKLWRQWKITQLGKI